VVLARAEKLQPELNCFITLCGDEAMAQVVKLAQQMGNRGGLAARDDQRVDSVEFLTASDTHRIGPRVAQRREVFAGVALQG